MLRYWQSYYEDSGKFISHKISYTFNFFLYIIDDYEGDSDQLKDVEQWYQQPADIPNTPTQNLIMLYVAIVLFNFSTESHTL